MLKNYLKIAFRNLVKHKVYSAINIVGLAIGMACSLLIILWVQDEKGIDAFHAHKNQLYRIYMKEFFSGKINGVIWTPGPLAQELKRQIPEIQYATAYEWPSDQTFAVGDKVNKFSINSADADFFKMFSFKLLQGTAQQALSNPNGIAISRTMAETFFGSPQAAIGKAIKYDNRRNYQVSVVFENIDPRSSIKFDCLRNWEDFTSENDWAKHWDSTDPVTFFMIREDAKRENVEKKIQHFMDQFDRDGDKKVRTELAMQPYHEYYLNSNFEGAEISGGKIENVRLFSFVAVFILLIACINFMNLATARSGQRSKEVGVRKAVGARQYSLVRQFMSEAVLIAIFSVTLALLTVILLLPAFNNLTGKSIHIPFQNPLFWLVICSLTLLTGVIAGSYPAFFLSALNPIKVLKGSIAVGGRSIILRKGLVVFQFSLSIMLIVGMIVVYQQLEYVQKKNLGFDRENLIYFALEGDLIKNYDVMKEEISNLSAVQSVSEMAETPSSSSFGTEAISWEGSSKGDRVRFTPMGVNYDFVKTMNISFKEGRDYSKTFGSDSTGVIINEAALKVIGFKDPIGKIVNWGTNKAHIIGVVKDFHFQSLRTAIRPMITYLVKKPQSGNVIVRIRAGKTREAIAEIEGICKRLNPNYPFNYSFTDQEYAKYYQSEQVVSKLSSYFASMAIFISCLGLFGLAIFSSEQRTKEIGIRKVLGASVTGIVSLLSKDYIKLLALAIIISSPIAWYTMHKWLSDFAYRIDIQWWVFAAAGFLVTAIAMMTVGFQSIKAAFMNPVKSLKVE